MRRISIGLLALISLLAVASIVALPILSFPAGRLYGWGLGVILSAVLAGVISWRVRWEVRNTGKAISRLPDVQPEPRTSTHLEFGALAGSLEAVSQRVQSKLMVATQEKQQLEALLDSMQDAVVAVDSAGRISWTNTRMQRLIPGGAVSSAVRIGHSLVQTIRDPDVLECVRAALEARSVSIRRTTTLMPGRIFEVNASPIPGGGAVVVLHDITRIEEVERTQRDFVANVSHELRTPLTSITGYVETLLDHEPSLGSQAREFLATILKNATRMNRLTEDLLVMARVEAPAMELHPTTVPADELIRDAVLLMSGLVQENRALLEIGEVTHCQVFADTDAVMQILANLIENAIKYGQPKRDPRSRVIVSAREVREPYDAVEFRVRDFGAGIASEHLSRIFERFYRVDKTRSRESGGTGLGLAIARHMVQTQGGTIWAESEMGSGSSFLFTLPKAIYPVVRITAK